jgi:acetolactate synthase-1/2/3 large subunit
MQLDILESELRKPTLIESEVIDVNHQDLNKLISMLNESKRPVMLMGTGVRLSGVEKVAVKIAEDLGIPVMTAWTHDVIESDHPNFVGRPGTIGTRPGNFIVQQCDLLLVLGSRLNIRQISYNWDSFAKNAQIIQVDVDPAELRKPFPKIELGVLADLNTFIPELRKAFENKELTPKKPVWLKWCKGIQQEFEVKPSDYEEKIDAINAYHLIPYVIDAAQENSIIVCGDATACIVPFQTGKIRNGMRMFSNSGSASMGFDLPAAIGASRGSASTIICFAGDGSVMMNLQELQTLAHLGADIKLFILDNGGYLSIKQTQENFFGRKHGSEVNSGLTFPDFTRVSEAFGLQVITLDPQCWRSQVEDSLSIKGPVVFVAHLNREQEFEPRLKSRVIDGKITTPDLDDMYPHLDAQVLTRVRQSVNEISE